MAERSCRSEGPCAYHAVYRDLGYLHKTYRTLYTSLCEHVRWPRDGAGFDWFDIRILPDEHRRWFRRFSNLRVAGGVHVLVGVFGLFHPSIRVYDSFRIVHRNGAS